MQQAAPDIAGGVNLQKRLRVIFRITLHDQAHNARRTRMGFLDLLEGIVEGASAGVAVMVALPICGAVVGTTAVVADHFLGEDDDGG
jgi:hypothetical protein